MQFLPESEWLPRQAAHRARVDFLLRDQLGRRREATKHPVYDFLFEYYHFRPGQLSQWHPGFGFALVGAAADDYLEIAGYQKGLEGISANPETLNANRRASLAWLINLLTQTLERPAFFGCHGLHEWAMVYRAPEIRHAQWPLRFSAERVAQVVEDHPICCSHFDAFRHFAEAAQPLNRLQPTRSTSLAFEQRGCLHANMDLYKWAFKFTPFVPSELTLDAFELALRIREIDMRASPYDFRELGFEPIPIETPEGRAEYEKWQRQFAEAAQPIRRRLLSELTGISESLTLASA